MTDFASLAINIAVILVSGGAVYGAIRADIRALTAGVGEAKESATKAHERIDRILER